MKIRRTPIALVMAAASLSLLVACSDEADQPVDAPPTEQVTPAPATPPVDTPPVTPAQPDPSTTVPPPTEPSVPDPGETSGGV